MVCCEQDVVQMFFLTNLMMLSSPKPRTMSVSMAATDQCDSSSCSTIATVTPGWGSRSRHASWLGLLFVVG